MTSAEKRQRQKANRQARIDAAREAQAKAQRQALILRVATIVVGVLVVGTGLWVLATRDVGDPEDPNDTTSTDSTFPDDSGSTESTVPAATVALPPGPEGRTLEGETPCPATDGSEERVAVFAQAPPTCIEPGEALTAEMAINVTADDGTVSPLGTVVIELDTEAAPNAVNNFVVLARYGFYDGIPFHRLMPGFVAQGGGSGAPGPDGTPDYGTTGPGYSLPDEEHPTGGYTVGDVAMARSAEVSGSQFFIVTHADGVSALDSAGNYPRFGRVTEGLEIAAQMADDGDTASNGTPLSLYTIESVTIR